MSHEGRARRRIPVSGDDESPVWDDACAAGTSEVLPKINQVIPYRAPIAIELDFDRPESPMLVYEDPDVVDMIEEERCPLADVNHSDGLHLYLDGSNHCVRCAMAAPWVRRDGCRS